jgi:hypothetical protein
MPSGQLISPGKRRKYASWILAARCAARRQALWLPVWASELRGIADDVVREIIALKPAQPRLRSSRLGHTKGPAVVVTMELPKHVVGFQRVMAAIAAHAGCKPATLYLWVEEYRASLGKPRQEDWRQNGKRGRRMSGDAYEQTMVAPTKRQQQLSQLVATTLRRDDEISE